MKKIKEILKKTIYISLAVIVSFMSFSCTDSESSKNTKMNYSDDSDISYETPINLNICSYNIGLFNHGLKGGYSGDDVEEQINNIKEFIAANDFDIMCLQENTQYIDSDQSIGSDVRLLSRAFMYNYRGKCNLTMSSKYPLSQKTTDFFKKEYLNSKCGYIKATTTINGKDITILSCHLAWQKDAAKTRKIQMQEIIEMLEDEERVILFGDWNVATTSEFDTLEDAGYRSINGSYLPLKRTFNYKQDYSESADESNDRYFDNILIKGIFVGSLKVHEVYDQLISDHLPISAKISLE